MPEEQEEKLVPEVELQRGPKPATAQPERAEPETESAAAAPVEPEAITQQQPEPAEEQLEEDTQPAEPSASETANEVQAETEEEEEPEEEMEEAEDLAEPESEKEEQTEAAAEAQEEETTASEEAERAEEAAEPAANKPVLSQPVTSKSRRLHQLQVEMEFRLGGVRLAINELYKLRAGAYFKLDRSLPGPIDVLVNGQQVAQGELVQIGDRLGVRLVEVNL